MPPDTAVSGGEALAKQRQAVRNMAVSQARGTFWALPDETRKKLGDLFAQGMTYEQAGDPPLTMMQFVTEVLGMPPEPFAATAKAMRTYIDSMAGLRALEETPICRAPH